MGVFVHLWIGRPVGNALVDLIIPVWILVGLLLVPVGGGLLLGLFPFLFLRLFIPARLLTELVGKLFSHIVLTDVGVFWF